MAKDWTRVFLKYKGQWVALQDDEETVIASGPTAKEAFEQAKKMGYTNPILARMPEKLVAFVGGLGL